MMEELRQLFDDYQVAEQQHLAAEEEHSRAKVRRDEAEKAIKQKMTEHALNRIVIGNAMLVLTRSTSDYGCHYVDLTILPVDAVLPTTSTSRLEISCHKIP